MDAETKKKIIEEYATHPGDTGSPDVQIALLTARIAHLTDPTDRNTLTAVKAQVVLKDRRVATASLVTGTVGTDRIAWRAMVAAQVAAMAGLGGLRRPCASAPGWPDAGFSVINPAQIPSHRVNYEFYS